MRTRLASVVPVGPTLRRWRRVLRRRRRTVTAVLAAICVVAALRAASPTPPATAPVLLAARDLAGGGPLAAGDLSLARLPPDAVPAGALTDLTQATGRTLAAPMRRGEPLTDVRLVGPRLVDALDPGLVATPVRIADPAAAALLQAGDLIDVLAAPADPAGGRTTLAAAGVRVLAVPTPTQDATDPSQGALVVLATTPATAAVLAAASTGDRLSVTLLAG